MNSHSAEDESGAEEETDTGNDGGIIGEHRNDAQDVDQEDDAPRIVDILEEERHHQSISQSAEPTPTLNSYKSLAQTENGHTNGHTNSLSGLGADSPAESVMSGPDDTPSIQVETL